MFSNIEWYHSSLSVTQAVDGFKLTERSYQLLSKVLQPKVARISIFRDLLQTVWSDCFDSEVTRTVWSDCFDKEVTRTVWSDCFDRE